MSREGRDFLHLGIFPDKYLVLNILVLREPMRGDEFVYVLAKREIADLTPSIE